MLDPATLRSPALRGIVNYAAADASDPFTLQRCLTHLRQGLLKPCTSSEMHWLCRDERGKWTSGHIGAEEGSDGGYTAQPTPESRKTAAGDDYIVTVYRNIARM